MYSFLVYSGTLNFPLYILCIHAIYSTLYIVHCTVYSEHCTMALHSVLCALYSVQCALYSVQWALYTIYYTLCIVQYTVIIVQRHYIVYNVHCIVYNVWFLYAFVGVCVILHVFACVCMNDLQLHWPWILDICSLYSAPVKKWEVKLIHSLRIRIQYRIISLHNYFNWSND